MTKCYKVMSKLMLIHSIGLFVYYSISYGLVRLPHSQALALARANSTLQCTDLTDLRPLALPQTRKAMP